MRARRGVGVAVLVVVVLAVSGCAGDDRGGAAGGGGTGTADEIPEVVDASATPEAGGTYRFDVTISSPYDRPERYADAWRVIGPDGTVLGVRELAHDHAAEQPFTRSLSGVEIQPDVVSVLVEARDLIDGWSGQTHRVELPGP